jgi:hypothetical protein
MKTLVLLAAFLCVPIFVSAAEPVVERPHWSLELKGGVFYPGASDWSKYYGSSYTGEYGGALAYKVLRQLELGVEGSYSNVTGKANAPLNGTLSGEVNNQLVPLGVFVLGRGIFYEKQLLVPYVGGGWNRTFYWQEVKNQGKVKGSVNGYYGRAGLQILLDDIDSESSKNLYNDYGVNHSYFFAEGKYSYASAPTLPSGTVNLGGTSWLGGFLFEF